MSSVRTTASCLDDLESNALQLLSYGPSYCQVSRRSLHSAELSSIHAGDRGKDRQRLQIIALRRGMVMVGSPQIDLTGPYAVIGIGLGNSPADCAIECLSHRNDPRDRLSILANLFVGPAQIE